ncbi:MAG: galactose mutarotase [Erysipelotrichaceae bacterium]|nr:galactose mutarotase [Erysipelotrichaceae bacterium]
MTPLKERVGMVNLEEVNIYTLENEHICFSVTNFGATLVKIIVPDSHGIPTNVILTLDSLADYCEETYFLNSTVVPNANRTRNASFRLDDTIYHLTKNDGENNLHSHSERGSNKRVWKEKELTDDSITFQLFMADGELGFPGNRTFETTFAIDGPVLKITNKMLSDRKTVFNPTNHIYYNLSGNIYQHQLQLNCSRYTPLDKQSIPTGEIEDVTDTPFDFRRKTPILDNFDLTHPQLRLAKGFDHNLLIDDYDGTLKRLGSLYSPLSGITMYIDSSLPGVQFYSSNYLGNNDPSFKYQLREAICLETQYCPDAMNLDNAVKPIVEKDHLAVRQTQLTFFSDSAD